MDPHTTYDPLAKIFDTPAPEMQVLGESVTEGDLTDEYIVNMMYEFNLNSHDNDPHHHSFPYYQQTKVFDFAQDVINFPTSDVPSDWHEEALQSVPLVSATASTETLETTLYPSPLSASLISNVDYVSPEKIFIDQELAKSPLSMPPVSQASGYLHSPPEASPHSMPFVASPGSFSEELSHSASLPGCSFATSNQPLQLPSFLLETAPTGSPQKRPIGEDQDPPKKKRGRKPKSEAEKAEALARKRALKARVKVYEIEEPYEDKEMERRRMNAVNSKRHRDQQKQWMKDMEQNLADAIIEKDILKRENDELRSKLSEVTRQLKAFQKHFGVETVPGWSKP